ncbi:MAG: hypothetical protein KTR30_38940 [Saprospiraceae bacterium]|nr:hypothetical protein [Saprospiraceae bacterium]
MKERRAELQGVDLDKILLPETPLEKLIIQDKGFRRGLLWGVPRYGHPEGEVYKHIRDVFDNIDRLQVSQMARERLRLVALVHDSFKHKEDKRKPRDWSKHHGVLARQFLAHYTDDEVVLTITEMHDEAYYIWRLKKLYKREVEGEQRLIKLLSRLGDSLQLFYLFFKCDTCTGDKIQSPLRWFEQNIEGIEVVDLFG